MPSLYEASYDEDVEEILEDLRKKMSKVVGVTLNGNRLTVRWYLNGELVDAHMIIERVTTIPEAVLEKRRTEQLQELYKKYPSLSGELFYIEHGEHPK